MVLFFTSTTARIIISNIVVLVQESVANFAGNISDVAQQVQGVAEGVGKLAEGVEATVEGLSKKSEADANTPVPKVAHTTTQIEMAAREVADNANAAAAFGQNAKHRDSSDDQISTPRLHTDGSQPDSAAEGIQAVSFNYDIGAYLISAIDIGRSTSGSALHCGPKDASVTA